MEYSTMISAIALLFAIITSYFSSKMKLAKFQAETNMKFLEFERRLKEHIEGNTKDLDELWRENREDHKAIGKDVKDIANMITEMKLEIAKKL